MRRLSSVLTVIAALPVLIALPVLSRPAVRVHPVVPALHTLAVAPVPAVRGVVADTGPRNTARFDLVGATWRAGSYDPAAQTVEVRTRAHGHWSTWTALEPPDGGADVGSPDARHAAAAHAGVQVAEPVWVGDADGVQARVVDAHGHAASTPADLHLVLVDGGSSAADADPGPAQPIGAGSVAEAAQSEPTIYTRAQWGADESLRLHACPKGPDYSPTIKMGFIHHTDGVNGYTKSQVPSIIRSIYAYHVESNGWCDIGYNFLVDRFGRIWEGRYGGITKAVIGAHTGGFNYDTFGTSLIGNFDTTAPSSAMLAGVERLFAWKFGRYYLDPHGTTTLVAGSFSGSRYAAGSTVAFNEVSGHRNADYTTCPGGAAYSDLKLVRSGITSDMGAGLVAPWVSPRSAQMFSGRTVTVAAKVITKQSWTVTVTNAQGVTVTSFAGTASRSTPIHQVWDLTDATGTPVLPGAYTVTLTSTNSSGVSAVPYRARVTVTPPVTITAHRRAAYDSTVKLGGTAVPDATVTVHLTDLTNATTLPDETVTASSTGTWTAPSLVADRDWSWSASVQDFTTPVGKTQVVPVAGTPRPTGGNIFFPPGAPALAGTALPGTSVTLLTTPVGTTTTTTSASIPVASDGSWTTTFVPSTPTVVVVKDSRGLASPTYTAYPVGTLTATAPTSGWSARSVTVTGNAGDAPVTVSLYAQEPGAADYSLLKRVTAGADGAFSVALPLPSVSTTTTLPWRVTTAYGGPVDGAVAAAPTFAPTATGPRRVGFYTVHTLHGTAVPGDVVTVWTRPTWSSTWNVTGRVTASDAQTWSLRYRFRRDTVWAVTSRSGRSADGRTSIVPLIHAPSSVASGGGVTIWGTALPRHSLTLYRQVVGGTSWKAVATVTVSWKGTWSVYRRLARSLRFYAVSHGQRSRVVTVSVG